MRGQAIALIATAGAQVDKAAPLLILQAVKNEKQLNFTDVKADPDCVNAWPVSDLSAFLAGDWRLERQLEDRLRGTVGALSGQAGFHSDPEGLAYTESGVLHMYGCDYRVQRHYRYHFPEPGWARVLFEDGRLFHHLDLRTGCWSAEHRCGADLYRGRFRALAPDAWRMSWQITGPRKDLRLKTWFQRN